MVRLRSVAGLATPAVAFLALVALFLAIARPAEAATDELGRTLHRVYEGQTLGKIAKRYHVSVEDLRRANSLRSRAAIRPGQVLVIPDGRGVAPGPAKAGSRWQDYSSAPKRRGYLVLESPTKRWRGVVLSRRGSVLPQARESIERMLASWRTGKRHEIEPRLIQLLVRVSDTFGGRPIRVVSGYRERSFAVDSKHKVGRAFDFSIPGVPNSVVKDYLRTLPKVGVGYYPNSTHVHFDVREQNVFWVDASKPGARPKYLRGGRPAPDDGEATEEGAESEGPEDAPVARPADTPGPTSPASDVDESGSAPAPVMSPAAAGSG